jgi:penicillin-binding protein-related factor A (putative recombinase)
LLDFNWLLNQDTKKIIFAKIKESCTNLAIVYPGILNLIETINNL